MIRFYTDDLCFCPGGQSDNIVFGFDHSFQCIGRGESVGRRVGDPLIIVIVGYVHHLRRRNIGRIASIGVSMQVVPSFFENLLGGGQSCIVCLQGSGHRFRSTGNGGDAANDCSVLRIVFYERPFVFGSHYRILG